LEHSDPTYKPQTFLTISEALQAFYKIQDLQEKVCAINPQKLQRCIRATNSIAPTLQIEIKAWGTHYEAQTRTPDTTRTQTRRHR